MRSRDQDGNTCLTDLEPPQAMDHRDSANRIGFEDLAADFLHLAHGHRNVAFVVEKAGLAIAGMVSHNPFKGDDRAIFTFDKSLLEDLNVDRLLRESVEARFFGGAGEPRGRTRGASAHRGHQGDLVSVTECRVRVGKLVIARQRDTAGHLV